MRPVKRIHRDASRPLSWLHPKYFGNEPIFGDALSAKVGREDDDDDDVLYYGSDEEPYCTPAERRMRCEYQAQRFIDGKPMLIHSATLRGPFNKASGWINPWRSQSIPDPRGRRRHVKRKRVATTGEPEKPSKRRQTTIPETQEVVVTEGHSRRSASGVSLPEVGRSSPECLIDHDYLDEETAGRIIAWTERVGIHNQLDGASLQSDATAGEATTDRHRGTSSQHLDSVSNNLSIPMPSQTFTRISDGYPTFVSAVAASQANTLGPFSSHLSPELSASSMALNTPGYLPLDITDLSPRAVEVYEEKTHSASFQEPPSPGTRPAAQTTDIAGVAAAFNSTTKEADTSFQTLSDRSFRFKSRTNWKKSSRKFKSLAASTDEVSPELEPERIMGDEANTVGAARPNSTEMEGSCAEPLPSCKNSHRAEPHQPGVSQLDLIVVDKTRDSAFEMDVSRPDRTQISEVQDAKDVVALDLVTELDTTTDTAGTPSPTAVTLRSSFRSTTSKVMSLGTFSFEKHQTQSFLMGVPEMPRKLLWPRSQQRVEDRTSIAPISPPPLGRAESDKSTGEQADEAGSELERSEEQESTTEDKTSPSTEQSPATTLGLPEEEIARVAPIASSDAPQLEIENVAPIIQLGSPIKEDESASKVGNPTVELGSPIQSPWTKGTSQTYISAALTTATEAHARRPHNKHGDSSNEPGELRSPWAEDQDVTSLDPQVVAPPPTPTNKPIKSLLPASQQIQDGDKQSPWAKGDSQIAMIIQHRPSNLAVGPVSSPNLPQDAGMGLLSPDPTAKYIEMANSSCIPSTPTRYTSSLPTPEFSLSIKSFRDFMTPSPAKRVPLGPADSNGRLPSTPFLVGAAVSNPWAQHPKKNDKNARQKKQVSWAPLPGEESYIEHEQPTLTSPDGVDLRFSSSNSDSARQLRAASPPPSILLASEHLPKQSEKFGRHFAAVVAKRRRQSGFARRSGVATTPLPKPARTVTLLPSASQQICESPAADAMAEAFVRADETGEVNQKSMAGEVMQDDREDTKDIFSKVQEPGLETQDSMDVVDEVLENLDDFLDRWDIGVELAKARASKNDGCTLAGGGGLMDIGVWE